MMLMKVEDDGKLVPEAKLTKEEADKIREEWRQAFLVKAKKRRWWEFWK